METNSNKSYFKTKGDVFLNLATIPKNKTPEAQGKIIETDRIALEIHHFQSLLRYELPEHYEDLSKLTTLMKNMYDAFTRKIAIQKLKKTEVEISGDRLSVSWTRGFESHEEIKITLGFPDYPFSIIDCLGTILSIEQSPNNTQEELLHISLESIEEHTRDLVIKFVNHLQRLNIKNKKQDEN